MNPTTQVRQLSFRNADLRDIFDALAKTYNLNLWLDEKVQGKTTLHLVNVSLNSVFELLAEQNQLVYQKSDNIIKVYKAPPAPPKSKASPTGFEPVLPP